MDSIASCNDLTTGEEVFENYIEDGANLLNAVDEYFETISSSDEVVLLSDGFESSIWDIK